MPVTPYRRAEASIGLGLVPSFVAPSRSSRGCLLARRPAGRINRKTSVVKLRQDGMTVGVAGRWPSHYFVAATETADAVA